MDFQRRLYDLRKKAGLSQEELANLVGVTRQAVQKWEAGTSRPGDGVPGHAPGRSTPVDTGNSDFLYREMK